MNLILDLCKKFKRQLINIKTLKAVSVRGYLLHLFGSLRLIFNGQKAIFPLNITLDLTYDCNLLCEFCFLNFLPNFRKENKGELLGFEEISALIKSIGTKNTSFLLTGGEPLLRKDLLKIINTINQSGFHCGLFTNATLLSPDISEKIIAAGLSYLLFSLDGPEKIHDALRGVPGSFKKTYGNIEYLINKRKNSTPRVIMNSLILDKNQSGLLEMVDIAKGLKVDCIAFDFLTFLTTDDFEAHRVNFNNFSPQDNFKSLVLVKDFKNADFQDLTKKIEAVKKYARSQKVRIFFKPDLSKKELQGWFKQGFRFIRRCIYPWNVMRVSPYGDVYPCAAFYIKMGNIRQTPVGELWNNRKFRDFRKLLRGRNQLSGCNRCVKL